MDAPLPISKGACRLIAEKGFAEPVEEVCKQRWADGAIAETSDHSEVMILKVNSRQRREMTVQVLTAGHDIGYEVGSVLRILDDGKSVRILEVVNRSISA